MIKVSFAVNDYRQTQGANKVIDQFILNKDAFLDFGICINHVYDYLNVYSSVPDRTNHGSGSSLAKMTKKTFLSDNVVYDWMALKRSEYRYNRIFIRNFKKQHDASDDLIVFQDANAAYSYLKKMKDKRVKICFLSHMYDDYMTQFFINRPHIQSTVIERRLRQRFRYVFDNSDAIFTICRHAKNAMQNFTSNKRIICIYNSVNVPVPEICPGKNDTVNFVMASSVTLRKGFDLLVEALGMFSDLERKQFNVHVFGDGDYLEKAVNISKAKGIDNLFFLGRVSEPYLHYQDKDVLLLTSRDETLPMSILEAMQVGLPVVSTNVGAVDELVFPNVNGVLINDVTSDGIYRGIKSVVESKQIIAQWGMKAREIFNEKFSSPIWVKSFSDAFCSLF